MALVLKIDRNVFNQDLTKYIQYVAWHPFHEYFPMEAGENHHRLLSYLVNQLSEGAVVADLGTHIGASAISLSTNPVVKVLSFDIVDHVPQANFVTYRKIPNIQFIKDDCLKYLSLLATCQIVLIDISPHDGLQERLLIEGLLKENYKGIVICDDIRLNQMTPFWDEVKLKKYDVTFCGHWSGTGIVVFDPSCMDVEIF